MEVPPMMQVICAKSNDQPLGIVRAKMSESSGQKIAEFSNSNSLEKLDKKYYQNVDKTDEGIDDLNLSYDHLYSTNSEENGEEAGQEEENNCQNAESEVKFLKEWLLMHLELVQQQNDDILKKEKTIILLQKENDMLKEKLKLLESPQLGNSCKVEELKDEPLQEDMGQDLGPPVEESSCEELDLNDLPVCDRNLVCSGAIRDLESVEAEKPEESDIKEESSEPVEVVHNGGSLKLHISAPSASSSIGSELQSNNLGTYVIHNSSCAEDDSKALRMNIRRKRLCSNSSAFSGQDSLLEEKRSRKSRKKRKRSIKEEQILTTKEQYYTQAGDSEIFPQPQLELFNEPASPTATSLEVPHWRVKVYASLYSMEGTENLEDEVYARRHARLENDERRRKRWDVQRIREQRHLEKLKQRQEKANRTEDPVEEVQSLWPNLDDIKVLEISEHLPVSAFGTPIPKVHPCEFSIPWSNGTYALQKKTKRSSGRRRTTKR